MESQGKGRKFRFRQVSTQVDTQIITIKLAKKTLPITEFYLKRENFMDWTKGVPSSYTC